MASDSPALPRSSNPADHIGRWLEHFRDRINLSALDAQARKPVRLRVAGPRAGDFITTLDPDAAPHSAVFELADGGISAASDAVKAFIYVRAADDPPMPDVLPTLGGALPVFVVEYQRDGMPSEAPTVTAPPDRRPTKNRAGIYHLSALSAAEMRKH